MTSDLHQSLDLMLEPPTVIAGLERPQRGVTMGLGRSRPVIGSRLGDVTERAPAHPCACYANRGIINMFHDCNEVFMKLCVQHRRLY